MQTDALELRSLTKRFGPVTAVNKVDLYVKQGEILALLGENGSGKTTLMNMISGIYTPDEGSIFLGGKEVAIRSPKDAIKHGIGMIHQHFKLVDVLTARQNIILGTKAGTIKNLEKTCEELGLGVELDKKIYEMSVGEKQSVEILKVLSRGAKVLILDEPTAVLTPQETDKLFNNLRAMRAQGKAIIIITHKLSEVMAISDRVSILRKGESVGSVLTATSSKQQLTEAMVGRPVELKLDCPDCSTGKPLLTLENVSVAGADRPFALRNISFSICGGEILGVAGVAGSGQKELCESIVGLQKISEGSVIFDGNHIEGIPTREIIKRGISMSFVPEDRLGMGLVGGMDIVDNLLLKSYHSYGKGPFLRRAPARELAKSLVSELGIVTPSIGTQVKKLSGGNVQKVLLGREIHSSPRILITAYPVRGLDINSSYTIYDMLNTQKKKGVGVLYIGEDLDVLLELCDRIMILCGGRITGIHPAKELTKEKIGLLMTGESAEHKEATV
ncbi:MAG: ABC transporter ATP-binding protein [Eubacteriales bacterium]|nr:ABC transporter ATP-binding protein [Eubacteriales bacterium]MDD4511820.1 ABC transporter ATP-binding protein [Eubacteriales bacterium]